MNILMTVRRLWDSLCRRSLSWFYKCTLGGYGSELVIDRNVFISLPSSVMLGDKVQINRNVILQSSSQGRIIIGNNVVISYGTKLLTGSLQFLAEQKKYERNHIFKDIVIGNDVWIGAGCIVLQGVHIGDNVVVAAGSTVTKSLESGYVYAGQPARPLRQIG